MSSMEIILSEPSRLERLAVDIHDHYVSSCANDPERVQKAMIVCSKRQIAYELLKKFQDKYPEWFEEKKVPDGISTNPEELRKLKPIIDTKSAFTDWLNNQIVRNQLKFDIKVCLIKNGYPPQYSPEVFRKVMEQVENFEEND